MGFWIICLRALNDVMVLGGLKDFVTAVIKSVMMGEGGLKIVQNIMPSFMDDPFKSIYLILEQHFAMGQTGRGR